MMSFSELSEYKKIILECKKTNKINLLEFEYLTNFQAIYTNSTWFTEIITRINNPKLLEIVKHDFPDIFDKNLLKHLIKDRKNINFTKEQSKALSNILDFLPNYQETMYGMYGYAGTGKTTILIELIVYLLKHKLINSVALTAPTNKALNVMKSKFRNYIKELSSETLSENFNFDELLLTLNIRIDFITIHKLLHFEMDFNSDGGTVFIVKGSKKSLLDLYNVIIIDECSMIPASMFQCLFNDIRKIRSTNNYKNLPKIIFSGDPAQLPPVHEKMSLIFVKNKDEYDDINYKFVIDTILKIPTTTLKKVMRTKLDSVMKVCYQIRLWAIDEVDELPSLQPFICQNDDKDFGVYAYRLGNKNKTDTKWFKKCVDYFKNKTDNNIILTWTNIQSDMYNNKIRKILFGKKVHKYEIGDILIFNEFYNLDNPDYVMNVDTAIYTSEQVKVMKVECVMKKSNNFINDIAKSIMNMKDNKYLEAQCKQFIEYINRTTIRTYECYKLTVKRLTDNNNSISELLVIKDSSLKNWTSDKETISSGIRKMRNMLVNKFPEKTLSIEDKIIKSLWKQFHKNIVAPFANVNYGYSITCHKGQGSGFFNVFVDIDDIIKNGIESEMKKCLYTAVSRAANELHILA